MNVPEELRSARRQLAAISEYEMLEDFVWYSKLNSWSLRFTLSCEILDNTYVPKRTSWYAVVSSSYPWGDIKIYPDQVDGVTHTFQHQDYNRLSEKFPWREGDICVSTSLIKWGRTELIEEPFDAPSRLSWHIKRTIEWIEAAAQGKLSAEGDPFELPQLPSKSGLTLVFNEDEETFAAWKRETTPSGICKIKSLKNETLILIVDQYEIENGRTIHNEWGSYLTQSFDKEYDGVWILMKKIPILPLWALPETWGELFQVATEQEMDLKLLLQHQFLKNKKRTIQFIQLGFPISERVGDLHTQIHWLSIHIQLPKKLNGFRDIRSEIKQATEILFAKNNKIKWIESENWNRQQITGRGVLSRTITKCNIVLIGAGAVGSLFCELLIRLGCKRITIVDQDLVNVGNFSRHTLSLPSIKKPKAQSLAEHLNKIFPFVAANFENQSLLPLLKKQPEFVHQFDIVVDATASDQVISILSDALLGMNKMFLSLSSGLKSNRLFGFIYKGQQQESIEAVFRKMISPWLRKEKAESMNEVLARDGIGCWHPLFPARIDDISMLLSAFIKIFEKVHLEQNCTRLTIIEKQYDDQNGFSGIQIIQE